MKLSACALTDLGLRRTNNEDAVFADPEAGLFMVADGMGGHAAGEVASAMALEAVRERMPPRTEPPADAARSLEQAVYTASEGIYRASCAESGKQGMGTTLSVLYLDGDQAQLAHVGDSRIYRLRDDKLEQLSIDHSLVAEQLRQGLLNEQEARSSRMRNILLQAVGLERTPEVFLLRQTLCEGDLFLLCSDGLSDMLEDAEISALLRPERPAVELATQLVEAAKVAGGRDNIGVVVVKIAEVTGTI